MARRFAAAIGAAVLVAAIPAAGQTKKARASTHEVDLIGCVQLEKEYRSDLNARPGGPLGSGAGQQDEYVLVKATPTSKTSADLSRKEAVATAGQQGDYQLTGALERELGRAVGRQVEVVGVVEQPYRASRNAKEDRNRLPRLAITSWHPVQDYCPAK